MEPIEIFFVSASGIVLTIAFTCANYDLYNYIFGEDEPDRSTSITDKAWFRGVIVPFIYFPGLNVIGLIILIYMRAMKALDIN